MAYGVTADGFVDKPVEVILAEIEAAQRAAFGDDFDTSAQSVAGQLNGIMAAHLRELWEVAQEIYTAMDPDSNTGEAQAAVASLTGTVKEAATYSTVTATVNLDAGVTLPAGSVASVSGAPASRFATLVAVTNSAGVAADVSVAMQAEESGPVVANSGTLTEIETPTTGWNSITNASDATLGSAIETEEELRIRREEELRRAGAAAVDAIRADVLDVADVTNVTVFENTSDAVDGDGLPAHSIEVVVLGGGDDAIAQAIWDSRAGGIEKYSSSADSGTATDDLGGTHTVEFTRPTEVPIYIDVEVTIDDDYPSDGDAQIKTALAAYAQANYSTGDDVIWSRLYAVVFAISGVVDVTLLETGIAPSPSGTSNIAIAARELATVDTSNITVTST